MEWNDFYNHSISKNHVFFTYVRIDESDVKLRESFFFLCQMTTRVSEGLMVGLTSCGYLCYEFQAARANCEIAFSVKDMTQSGIQISS